MKRQDVERVLAIIEEAWGDSSEVETHPYRTLDRIASAVRALADPEPCEHSRAAVGGGDGKYLICPDCGEAGCTRPCGICNSQFCRCSEYGLR